MRSITKTQSWLSVLLLGLGFLSAPILLFSQALCPIKTVRIKSIHGQVIENSKAETPWRNISVELRSGDSDQTLISKTNTNENGVFRFDSVKKGTYLLDFRTTHFPSYRLVVKARGSNDLGKGGSFIVKLDPDCGKTQVRLVNK